MHNEETFLCAPVFTALNNYDIQKTTLCIITGGHPLHSRTIDSVMVVFESNVSTNSSPGCVNNIHFNQISVLTNIAPYELNFKTHMNLVKGLFMIVLFCNSIIMVLTLICRVKTIRVRDCLIVFSRGFKL